MVSKVGFPEDDERELESELAQAEDTMDAISRDMRATEGRRNHLRKQIAKRQIDPLVAKALEIAQNFGHALGANEALANRIGFLEKRINVRDAELSRIGDRDWLLVRAETAEAIIARSKKPKNRRR